MKKILKFHESRIKNKHSVYINVCIPIDLPDFEIYRIQLELAENRQTIRDSKTKIVIWVKFHKKIVKMTTKRQNWQHWWWLQKIHHVTNNSPHNNVCTHGCVIVCLFVDDDACHAGIREVSAQISRQEFVFLICMNGWYKCVRENVTLWDLLVHVLALLFYP